MADTLELATTYAGRSAPSSQILSAWRAPAARFTSGRRPTMAQKLGLRYEKLALNFVETEILLQPGLTVSRDRLERQPHFRFQLAGHKVESCLPDALIEHVDRDLVTLVEVKLRHTYDAYFQLTRLYLPVARAIYGAGVSVRRLEIVKSYDPNVKLPEDVEFVSSLRQWLAKDSKKYAVLMLGRVK